MLLGFGPASFFTRRQIRDFDFHPGLSWEAGSYQPQQHWPVFTGSYLGTTLRLKFTMDSVASTLVSIVLPGEWLFPGLYSHVSEATVGRLILFSRGRFSCRWDASHSVSTSSHTASKHCITSVFANQPSTMHILR